MRGKIYYRLRTQLFLAYLGRKAPGLCRLFGLALMLFGLLYLPSSGRQERLLVQYRVIYGGKVHTTAYNSLVSQCDDTPWITASGTRCREGVIAANHLPFGTKVVIQGFGDQIVTVEDRMNARYKRRIDIWMRHYSDARRYGVREVKYFLLEQV